jgi:hypothetical protein
METLSVSKVVITITITSSKRTFVMNTYMGEENPGILNV